MEQVDKTEVSKRNLLALFILLGAFAVSVFWVHVVNRDPSEKGPLAKKIIRMVHDVSDKSVINAFNELAGQYEKEHPDVKLIIQSIPTAAYQQWMTTQFLGRTAPDLMYSGYTLGSDDTLTVRYVMPLTDYVNRPNPYNRGTELQGWKWKDTFIDRMRSGYMGNLTEYYSVPLTIETDRIFYNKDIFRAATGSDKPPANFREWMEICEKIKRYAEQQNRMLFPIAASRIDFTRDPQRIFQQYYFALTEGMVDDYDPSYWSSDRPECTLYGLYTNSFTFKNKQTEAPFRLVKKIAQQCQPGFGSYEVEQARFLFVQDKAAMTVGNVKDARIFRNVAGFDIGAFNLPLPARDDPEYGQYIKTFPTETEKPSFNFSVNMASRYPEIAIDFLMFCTSVEMNEKFNAMAQWYPVIKTAKPLDYVSVFKPQTEGGAWRTMHFGASLPQVRLWFEQNITLYLQGRLTYEQFADGLDEIFLTEGARDYVERDRRFKQSLISSERNIARAQGRMLFEEAGRFEAGRTMSKRTSYQLALEAMQVLEHGISARTYTWHHLQKGNYQFP